MSKTVLVLCIVLSTIKVISSEYAISKRSGNFAINVQNIDSKTEYTVEKFGQIKLRVYLGRNFSTTLSKTDTSNGFTLHGANRNVQFDIVEDSESFTLVKVTTSLKADQIESHCIDLNTGHLNWFGGPQIFYQYWPVEKHRFNDYSYLSKQQDNVAVAERYWLNSKGGFIYVDDKVPLFIDQNLDGNTLCLKSKNQLPYNTRRTSIDLVYHLGTGKDPKEAQKNAVKTFLKKPTDVADRRMVEHPIWSTWARYKRDVNESSVEEYVSEIEKHGFNNSQFEIDDDWEVCYGALTFRDSKFSNIKKQTDDLRARGFRVTLWIDPFINKGCEPWYSEAKEKGYFVTDQNGNPDTMWWNSKANESAYIDFTKPEAAKWYASRLEKLQQEAGIDSYKFDAGETSWLPPDPKLNASLEDHPLEITKTYIRTVAQFGPIAEVRSAQGTQDLPVFVRFIDKDTFWNYRNGLHTLITSLIQMNMVGYGFILPDMVGGNGYGNGGTSGNFPPSEELFVRWLQANVFMPSIQYSYVPWQYSEKAIEICRHFTDMHASYTDDIMNAFQAAVDQGEPVNPPIWWLDPTDEVALNINDEFLLGDRILSAPVIEQGAVSRDVYLPKGTWNDPNLQKTYQGPIWLSEYPAPIEVLPYFIREDSTDPTPKPPTNSARSFDPVSILCLLLFFALSKHLHLICM